MTKQRVEEIINYYSVSVQILEEMLKSNTNIDDDNKIKATISHGLFKDTVECLNELVSIKNFDGE